MHHLFELPSYLTPKTLDQFLTQCHRLSVSEIHLQTFTPIWIEREGRLEQATKREMTHSEVVDFLQHLYGLNGPAQILSGKDINTHYECRISSQERYRFRVNATGCLIQGVDGIQVTLRVIPDTPPTLNELGLEPELMRALMPRQGVIYVTGPTGSGKSTLLAAIIRNIAENKDSHQKILTYESPIEFTYDMISKPTTIISQTEIPKHIASFELGIQNALRRKPRLILIGEAQEPSIIRSVIEAGLMGHPVYTTLHSSGVVETIRRLVHSLKGQTHITLLDVLETVRVIVWQQLIPSRQGNRIAVREFLVFDDHVRHILLDTPPEKITVRARALLESYGQPMHVDIKHKFDSGIISEETFRHFSNLSAQE